MAKRVSKKVPPVERVAERIIEFSKDDFCENISLSEFSEDIVTKKMLEDFAAKALVLVDCTDILQYANEYPIVVYQCADDSIMPEPCLNSFIMNIAVSTGVSGKRFSVDSGKIEEEITDFDTIAYYEDSFGIKHQIIQYDICKFLLKKPKLVISEEGVLVFYTEDEILATTDCQQYVWVRWDDTIKNCTSIENIIAYKEYCEVTLIEGDDKYLYDEFVELYKAPRHVLHLNFDLNVAEHNMINPKIKK